MVPRIELAQKLAKSAGAGLHAMMDLSDGLAADLPRMCGASGVGGWGRWCRHTGRLPIHADAEALSEADGIPAGLHALADGEDYELLFALDTNATPEIIPVAHATGVALTAIGTITAERELRLLDESNRAHPWPRVGWEHKS